MVGNNSPAFLSRSRSEESLYVRGDGQSPSHRKENYRIVTKRYTLMIPGPIDVSEEVLREMGAPVVAHYGSDWVEIYQETIGLLKQAFQTNGDVFILAGSGTAGLDAAIGGLLRSGEKVLVLINGFFGERLFQIARAYDLDARRLEFDIFKPLPVAPVEEFLRREKDIQAILMVHHDTHTGIVNPVKAIGQLGKEYDVPLIVDAVSSLGGIDLKVDEWGVDICVAASQKGLESPPGLALISISERAWRIMDAKGSTGHGFYLDPRVWREHREKWGSWHPTHVTLPGNIVLALQASLRRILAEGLEEHFARYRRVSRVVKSGMKSIGLELLVDETLASPIVTTARTPSGIQAVWIRDFLRDKRGILISFGPPQCRENSIRVGHMGEQMRLDHIIALLCGLEDALRDCGIDIPCGSSLTDINAFWKG
ncbi:MAG: alanine--glyoxylate aminotransferase family protein [Chloroflexi bacterium]|nr:alanine--glyoxylate aminotransferase family protein [Chloroflexota bacterium]